MSNALAINSPSSLSLLAAIEATLTISLNSDIGFAAFRSDSDISSTCNFKSLETSTGLAPSLIKFIPLSQNACAKTHAVVVPSPAKFCACVATSINNLAPISTNSSS